MRLSKKSGITKLSSASVQPHPLNPPLLSVEGDFKSPSPERRRVGMMLKPKNILWPVTFETASLFIYLKNASLPSGEGYFFLWAN